MREYVSGGGGLPAVEYIRGSDYGGGIGGLLYSLRGGIPSFKHYNSRGDVVAATDANSSLTYQAAYEAFGHHGNTPSSEEWGSTPDRQKANTKDEDPTGLLNEGFRYRDLETGTFITRDPLGFVDGPNVYTYVVQNPWTKFDPNGLYSWQEYKSDFSAGLDFIGDYTIRSPRFMGGMQVLGGIGEAGIAVGLAGAPEPTMATKAGAAYMGMRAADHILTGSKQIWTGEWQQTISHQAMSEGLELGGMSPEMASSVANYLEAGLDVFSINTGIAIGLRFNQATLGSHSPSSVSGTISARTIAVENDDIITVYRGIHPRHPGLSDALQGRAAPIGGHSSPMAHNEGLNRSIFTSWTTDPRVAHDFSRGLVQGFDEPGGVILQQNVARSRLIRTPDIHGELEVLRVGVVEDAIPIIISK